MERNNLKYKEAKEVKRENNEKMERIENKKKGRK